MNREKKTLFLVIFSLKKCKRKKKSQELKSKKENKVIIKKAITKCKRREQFHVKTDNKCH